MSVRAEGSSWRADVTVRQPGGRIRRERKLFSARRDAERWERSTRTALLDGSFGAQRDKPDPPMLRDWAREYLDNYTKVNNKTSTWRTKEAIIRLHIVPELGRLRIDRIGRRDFEALKARLVGFGLKAKSINNYLSVLHNMLAVAQRWELIEHVPSVHWLKSCQPGWRFLEASEAEALLEAAGEWRCMILLALRTGLRAGELRGLRWADVDLLRSVLTVRTNLVRGETTSPKSGKARTVALSQEAVMALREHRHLRGIYVFCGEDGSPTAESTMRRGLRHAAEAAGLGVVGWHTLRHTFASHLVLAGVPIRVVQELLGHATVTMTERYSHLAPNTMQEAVARLPTATWRPK
jgi:integrase